MVRRIRIGRGSAGGSLERGRGSAGGSLERGRGGTGGSLEEATASPGGKLERGRANRLERERVANKESIAKEKSEQYERDFAELERQEAAKSKFEETGAQTSLASVISRAAHEKKRTDVMGRRGTRLRERGIRDELIENYKERGVDINPEVAMRGYRNAKNAEGWDNLDDFGKRARMSTNITDAEATRRTWMGMDDDILHNSRHVTTDEFGNAKILDPQTQERFDKSFAENRNAIINGKSQQTAGEAFDINSISMDGVGKGGQYAFNKEVENVRFAEANLNRALTNEDVGKSLKSRLGIESDDRLREVVNNPTTRNELFTNRLDSAKSNPGFMDNMMGNKVPHMAGGALLTVGLANALFSSKGQQSNAQLYGQQQPYY